MLLKHCTLAELAMMSMDDAEVETRVLDAWLEATVKARKKRDKKPPIG